jgi:OmpA-OmpF porin, OOP family
VYPAVRTLLLGIVLSASTAATVAQGIRPDAGFYLGGALGPATFKEWCTTGGAPNASFNSCEDTDTAWKLLGGYRFNRYFALEASYIEWGEVTANLNLGVPPTSVQVAASQHSYGLAAVGTLPLGERFELFGKAGLLQNEQETRRVSPNPSTIKRDETGFHYGLGAKYAVTRNWALRGEWENTEKLKAEMLSIGVEYRF